MSGSQVVTFDYATWAGQYPELAAWVSEPQALNYWTMATLYVDNAPTSPICDLGIRAMILNMTTSHIATLLGAIGGNEPSPLVGRINQASEGSVSVSTDFPTTPNAAWFVQTKYGAMAWAALAPFRTALYIAAPQRPLAAQSFPWFVGGGQWLP